MPYCPYCDNSFLDSSVKLTNFEACDEHVILHYTGVCPECLRKFAWEEFYQWDGCVEEVREVK